MGDADLAALVAHPLHMPQDAGKDALLSPAFVQHLQLSLRAGLPHQADAQYACQLRHRRADPPVVCQVGQGFKRE